MQNLEPSTQRSKYSPTHLCVPLQEHARRSHLVSQIQAGKENAITLDPSRSCIFSHIIEYLSYRRVLDLRSNILKNFFETWCSLLFFSFELCWTKGILRVGCRGGCLCCRLCGTVLVLYFCRFRWKYYMKPHHRHVIFWSLELPLCFGWGRGWIPYYPLLAHSLQSQADYLVQSPKRTQLHF